MQRSASTSEKKLPTESRPGHRIWADPARETFLTAASAVTLVRTVLSVGLAVAAAQQESRTLLLVALGVYWFGDSLDGWVARITDRETRAGAIFDILCDRLCCAAFYVGLMWLVPEVSVAVAIYLVQFMVVDMYLSIAFLAWPVTSPNYFYVVDRTLWLWNWSKPGKTVNSALFAILLVVTENVWLGGAIALALLALKSWSLLRLVRLGLPIPAGGPVEPGPTGPTGAPGATAP